MSFLGENQPEGAQTPVRPLEGAQRACGLSARIDTEYHEELDRQYADLEAEMAHEARERTADE